MFSLKLQTKKHVYLIQAEHADFLYAEQWKNFTSEPVIKAEIHDSRDKLIFEFDRLKNLSQLGLCSVSEDQCKGGLCYIQEDKCKCSLCCVSEEVDNPDVKEFIDENEQSTDNAIKGLKPDGKEWLTQKQLIAKYGEQFSLEDFINGEKETLVFDITRKFNEKFPTGIPLVDSVKVSLSTKKIDNWYDILESHKDRMEVETYNEIKAFLDNYDNGKGLKDSLSDVYNTPEEEFQQHKRKHEISNLRHANYLKNHQNTKIDSDFAIQALKLSLLVTEKVFSPQDIAIEN